MTHSRQSRPYGWLHRSRKLMAGSLFALICSSASAQLVLYYDIEASAFVNSSLEGPLPPTSNTVSGRLGISIDLAASSQDGVVPVSMTGFTITSNDGSAITYTPANAGVNARRLPNSMDHEITLGGLVSTIDFMAGLSNDMRVKFTLSGTTFDVLDVTENVVFVTPNDPFYDAQTTTVTFVEAVMLTDTDADGLTDNVDNCTDVANPQQVDTDADNLGNACDADFNQDCVINFQDVAVLAANFLSNSSPLTDLNDDGVTNFVDYALLTSRFLQPPGPSGLLDLCD